VAELANRPVTNLSVRSFGARREGILESMIEAPTNGGGSDAWGVRVRGHVLGTTGPAHAVEAVIPGRVLASAPAALPTPEVAARHPNLPEATACGFALLVDTLALPRQFEFRLRATFGDGSRPKLATIRGERRALTTDYTPRLQPLLVTSLGRMGTTLLMRILAAHPAVATYLRPPYETRGGKYWLHVLKTLAAPADASKRIGATMEFHLEPLAVGGNPFYSAAFAAWPEVEAWSGSTYLENLAAFCQQSIDGWYLATARAQGQETTPLVYFAEKQFPDDYSRLWRELYPGARELFLVRDFRDMVASMMAYNTRRGFGDFGREAAGSDAAWLAQLRRGVEALRDAWRDRGEPGNLVHYETLVRDPLHAVPILLETLGLDATPTTLTRLLAAAAPDSAESRAHATSGSPDASIGRWQTDLSPELQAMTQETFGDLLTEFGYDLP
jgi:hypothetical protein